MNAESAAELCVQNIHAAVSRCKKMFCRDCMTPDVATGDPNAMLCLHCARRIVSPRTVSKWSGLEGHLKFRAAFTTNVKLTFARIDGLIGSNLPMAAYRDSAWWSNTSSSIHAKLASHTGWEVQEVESKRRLRGIQKSSQCGIQKIEAKKTRDYPSPSLLYQYIGPNQRFHLRPKCQSSTRESRTLNGNEQCHTSQ